MAQQEGPPSAGVRRDFGSFHSSNVQELIAQNETDSHHPTFPVGLPCFSGKAQYGKEMKEKHFLIEENWTFINHGAFGAVVKEALQAAFVWQTYCEKQPLRFLDRELLPHLVYVTKRLAKFVDADPADLVLLPNVTTGNSTVVKSIVKQFLPGNSIYTLNLAYGATKKLLRQIASEHNVHIEEATVMFPVLTDEEILSIVDKTLRDDTKLAIFDHIPSNYGIILPVKKLVELCHKRGIQVLIDGAHALGSLDISMRDINADYYVSNCHKWLCNPKGCAFLYVAKPHQQYIRPLVISHGFGSGFSSEFIWAGLKDYSAQLALHTVFDFWEHYGVQSIRQHIVNTARAAGALLQRAWGTSLLAGENMFGPMVLVELPSGIIPNEDQRSIKYDHAEIVQNKLYHGFQIEVPVKAIQNKLYVRISAHIYNHIDDYMRLAEAVNELIKSQQSLKDPYAHHAMI
eukprot:Em0019g1035a